MADQVVTSALQNAVQQLALIAKNIAASFPVYTTTQTTVGAAGGASALPATPLGYLNVTLPDGTAAVIPYYRP